MTNIVIRKEYAGCYKVVGFTYGCGSSITIQRSYDDENVWRCGDMRFDSLRHAKATVAEMAACGEYAAV
jgi:hypothetical protein